MPRLILTSRYLKPSKSSYRSYLIKYIATRDRAEPVTVSLEFLNATKKQEQLISKITKDFPDTMDTHEYADYILNSNRKNASDFITQALENNLDRIGNRKNYVDYVANRPRAERLGTHGLFSDEGPPIVLDQTANEVADHPGNVWTTVISLRREDAARLGFDNAETWRALIRSKRSLIAESMKIHQDNLKWYASFHNESHHPHVHLIAYSTDPKEGYLTEKGIEKLRSAFARDIFKQDLIQIYDKQTKRRNTVNEQAEQTMDELIAQMRSGACINKQLEADILLLSKRLKNTKGKKVYGYLKPDIKAIVNRIIDEMAKTDAVSQAYDAWYEMRNEVLKTYTDKLPAPIPLSQQKDFRIRQTVIDEAMRIANGEFTLEPDTHENEPDDNATYDDTQEPRKSSAVDMFTESAEQGNEYAQYALGKLYLLGFDVNQDREKAAYWFSLSATQGNTYAQYFMDHMNDYDPSALLMAVRLLNHLSQIFEDTINATKHRYRMDKKARSKEREKKIAQGHALDDYEPEQTI